MKDFERCIIVLDLDGTLLNSRKEVSPQNYKALKWAAEQGHLVVPCTGRFYAGMPRVVRELSFVRYVITVNGAQIYDTTRDQVIHSAEIPWEKADEVFEVLDRLPVIYDCYQDGWGWMERSAYDLAPQYIMDPAVLNMVQALREPVEDLRELVRQRGRGVQKIQMFFADMEHRSQAMEMLSRRFADLVVTSSITNNIEITSAQAHKGAALAELCRQLEVSVTNTVSFGDGLNDITMLQTAGIGIAMANASEAVKAQADAITDTNDRDGVAKAIIQIWPDAREFVSGTAKDRT